MTKVGQSIGLWKLLFLSTVLKGRLRWQVRCRHLRCKHLDMSDESHVMAGFQIKFLLLQKTMNFCKIERKRKQACFFFFSLCLAKIQVAKLILQSQQYCIYSTLKFASFSSKLHVLRCIVGLSFPTALWPFTQKVWQGNYNLAMWDSDPQRNCKTRRERETKKLLCFPGSSDPFMHGNKGNIPSIFRRNMSDLSGFEPSSYNKSKIWIFGFSCLTCC